MVALGEAAGGPVRGPTERAFRGEPHTSTPGCGACRGLSTRVADLAQEPRYETVVDGTLAGWQAPVPCNPSLSVTARSRSWNVGTSIRDMSRGPSAAAPDSAGPRAPWERTDAGLLPYPTGS
ncbi:hypothetical protein GCM10015535_64120 [Streptomyces gelaticus]|uniref:Uncharacterized protein n=1 Tax=Streptomyces gelaticus TaxID=285446 RepID=A0ABQ2W7R9_9ACTN|nr:hypothetical protein GCM10015535_64120 [Streptomyces gelaticus]